MEGFENTDDFLAKWSSGELSETEKEAFKSSKDYVLYKAILEGTDGLDVPEYDKASLLEKVKQEKKKAPKVIKLNSIWMYAAAASIALLLGAVWFMNRTITYETNFGEQLALHLPDGSEVILNSGSQLSYKKRDWKDDVRTTNLSGEAFFKVEKGSDFVVQTKNGKVTVLGTEFTVNTYNEFFNVNCFEGKVAVVSNAVQTILTKGKAVRIYNGQVDEYDVKSVGPNWSQEESSFENAPLHEVINALEKQYGISIDSGSIDIEQLFTGSFTHSNLEIALRTVFESMQIRFTFSNENTIILG